MNSWIWGHTCYFCIIIWCSWKLIHGKLIRKMYLESRFKDFKSKLASESWGRKCGARKRFGLHWENISVIHSEGKISAAFKIKRLALFFSKLLNWPKWKILTKKCKITKRHVNSFEKLKVPFFFFCSKLHSFLWFQGIPRKGFNI